MQLQITTITYRLKTETFILKPGELFTLVADFTTQMDSSVANPSVWDTQKVFKHHEQRNVAQTRPKYREGRRLKAVKVGLFYKWF